VKILVADQDGHRAVALAAQLRQQDDQFVIMTVQDGETLMDSVTRARPDVVLVDMARPDRDGLDSIRALNIKEKLPVVMFTDDDDPGFMEDAIAAGVISYHVYDVGLPAIKPVLRTALAFFKHSQQINSRLAAAEQQLASRRTIEMAKRLLMTQDKMSEPAAHRFLQRQAMGKQKRLHEVAESLLRERGIIER